jgi:hypothetical protein
VSSLVNDHESTAGTTGKPSLAKLVGLSVRAPAATGAGGSYVSAVTATLPCSANGGMLLPRPSRKSSPATVGLVVPGTA